MPGFSSRQKVGPSVGGCNSTSITSTALGTKAGSRSSIQESKTVQAQVVRLEDAPHGTLAGRAQAQRGGKGGFAPPGGGARHVPRPPRLLLGAGAGPDDPLQLRPLVWA